MSWFTKPSTKKLDWKELNQMDQLVVSEDRTVLYFKHSRRCATSIMALRQFENNWDNSEDCEIYFLDLLKHRDISNEIERISGVKHESPQVIVMREKKVIYHASHSDIDTRSISKALKEAS